ncbi:MAG: PLDc N-terminal domain-containing protein [Bacteroidota bacterium]|nr:PLDc N-terminal domain-containing protein [Bacteroidota bacterium]
MKLGMLVTTSFIISFMLTLAGACLKIMHAEGAGTWLTMGIIASILFIVTAIYEVRTSKRIDDTEKIVWTLAFIFFSGITGLIYILMGRKRIAAHY